MTKVFGQITSTKICGGIQRRSLELTVPRLPISPMTSLSSLVGPYPTGIVRLVLDEMFSAIIRSIRVTAAVTQELNGCQLRCTAHPSPVYIWRATLASKILHNAQSLDALHLRGAKPDFADLFFAVEPA